jgi:hypothetical protein
LKLTGIIGMKNRANHVETLNKTNGLAPQFEHRSKIGPIPFRSLRSPKMMITDPLLYVRQG